MGFSLGIVALYSLFFKLKPSHVRYKAVILVLCFHILILFTLSLRRNQMYRDPSLLWEEVLSLYPDNPRALNNMGTAYANQGRGSESAKRAFERAEAADPNDFMAQYNLGVYYGKNKEYEKAIPYYEKSIELNPNYISSYNNLGIIFKERGQLDKAVQLFIHAVQMDPQHINARYNLADTYLEQRNYDNALQEFENALKLAPNAAYIQQIQSKIEQIKRLSR